LIIKLKNNKILVNSFKVIVLIAAYGYMYIKFKDIEFKVIFEFNNYLYLFLALLLMPLNWLIESRKWQLLISNFEIISIYTSFKAVLSGLTTSIFTPNRVGEFVGRIMYISSENRVKATFSTILGSYSQILITLIIGSFSVLFIKQGNICFIDNNIYLKWSFLVFTFLLITLFFSLSKFIFIFNKMNNKYIRSIISTASGYSSFDLVKLMFLSLIRYFVFYTQFYLLLQFFSIDISIFESFITIGIFYLFLMFIPTFVISEPGVRISTSILVFSVFVEDVSLVVYTVSLLWIINIVLPTIIGSVFFVRQK